MSLNNITIGTAKWLTTKNNLQGCMILAIENGQVKAVSYGADKHKCRQLAALVDRTIEATDSGVVNLSCFEPPLAVANPDSRPDYDWAVEQHTTLLDAMMRRNDRG